MSELIGKVTEGEMKELVEFCERDSALGKVFQRFLSDEQALLHDREVWFDKIREKYNILTEQPITINHKTGQIFKLPAEN